MTSYFEESKQKYIGKYVFLLKDKKKGYLYEVEKSFLEIGKATEGIGYVGFKFREQKRSNENKGIGFYKIVNMKKSGDDIFAYVEFVTLITHEDNIALYKKTIMLFELLYSNPQTLLVDDLFSIKPFSKRDPIEYEADTILIECMEEKFECNCAKLMEYLEANGFSDKCVSIPYRAVKLIEKKHITDGSIIVDILSTPSKMMEYARYTFDAIAFDNLRTDFPELYNKLDKQINIYDFGALAKLYDYFYRAHAKYKKYYGPSAEELSMEDEMKAVFEYERAKKQHEKEQKKRRRKEKKNENKKNAHQGV